MSRHDDEQETYVEVGKKMGEQEAELAEGLEYRRKSRQEDEHLEV